MLAGNITFMCVIPSMCITRTCLINHNVFILSSHTRVNSHLSDGNYSRYLMPYAIAIYHATSHMSYDQCA